MALLWQLFPFIIIASLLIQLIPVRINLYFLRENKNDFMTVRVNTFFSLLRFQVEVPELTQKKPLDVTMEAEIKAGEDKLVREEKETFSLLDLSLKKIRRIMDIYRNNKKQILFTVRFMSRATTVESLTLTLRAGTGDAALTALLYGLCWTAAGSLTTLAEQRLKFKQQPMVKLAPDFSHVSDFYLRADTTLSYRIGHFTVVGLVLLFVKLRGGDRFRWKNILSRG